ncbi:hypothetical protein FRX31_032349 [Thalictrum thalictroides]|uniref:Uncharacterized protein n=1 Tax=Thalictrum thalictroides TaxID=46969 RepID=A0A7J6UZG3_THATH|nr:hypothetical protein FRX31_032349 [Thalictrum thalictroides]
MLSFVNCIKIKLNTQSTSSKKEADYGQIECSETLPIYALNHAVRASDQLILYISLRTKEKGGSYIRSSIVLKLPPPKDICFNHLLPEFLDKKVENLSTFWSDSLHPSTTLLLEVPFTKQGSPHS